MEQGGIGLLLTTVIINHHAHGGCSIVAGQHGELYGVLGV
jgi:hypothetical protein